MPLPIRRATPQRPPTRSRSRTAPAQPYNSGGIPPIVTVAVQKRRPLRAIPDANSGSGVIAAISPQIVIAPPFNSGGLTPRVTAGIKRRNLSRPGSRRQVAAPYNSGGIAPTVAAGIRRRNLTRGPVRLLAPAYNSGSLRPASLVRGVLRKLRAALRAQVVVPPTANVVVAGTPPRVTTGVRRPPPLRGRSRVQVAPRFNSGNIVPAVPRGIGRVAAKNRPSRPLPAPPYNSGGVLPRLSQGARRPPAKGRPSRALVAPIQPAPPGTPPVVTRSARWAAVRWQRPRAIVAMIQTGTLGEPAKGPTRLLGGAANLLRGLGGRNRQGGGGGPNRMGGG